MTSKKVKMEMMSPSQQSTVEEEEEDKMNVDDADDEDSSHDSTSSSCGDAGVKDGESSSDDDEDAESSEFDEDINVVVRDEYMTKMHNIESSFSTISKRLYSERRRQIDKNYQELRDENSAEFLEELKLINEAQEKKLRIVDIRSRLHHEMLKKMNEADKLACAQQLQNDKQQLLEQLENEFEDKFRRLQEDRDNIDLAVERFSENLKCSKGRKASTSKWQTGGKQAGGGGKRKKKPITVTGPYIVYQLREEEILSDLAEIRKAVALNRRTKIKNKRRHTITHACRYEDGKLVYSGRTFQKGQHVVVRNTNNQSVVNGTIAGINEKQFLVKNSENRQNWKYSLHHLQRGQILLYPKD